MKNLKLCLLLFAFILGINSQSLAQGLPVGARYAGMGGVGVAISSDIKAAYYNPAGLMSSPSRVGEITLSGGLAMQNLEQMAGAFSSASDPAKFFSDYYSKEIDANGSLSGIIGGSVAKIGLSLIPTGTVLAEKDADTVNGDIGAHAGIAEILTLGRSFSTPGLPIASLDIGGNIKYITDASGGMTIAGATPPNVTSTAYTRMGTGFGLDIGARSNLPIPLLNPSVGIVVKNLFQTINYEEESKDTTIDTTDGKVVSTGPAVKETVSYTSPLILAIGGALTVPATGTFLGADLESISGSDGSTNLRMGIEHPFLFGVVPMRLGYATGTDLSQTTLGFGFHIGLNLDVAYVIDNKNSKNTATVLEASAGF